jgi:hypothetical protein
LGGESKALSIPLQNSPPSFNNEEARGLYDASERVLCQDVLGLTNKHHSVPTATAKDGEPLSPPPRYSIPQRLDRIQRRLGFAPLPFACLIWNFMSAIGPRWAWWQWLALYAATATVGLAIKVAQHYWLEQYAAWRLSKLGAAEDKKAPKDKAEKAEKAEEQKAGAEEQKEEEGDGKAGLPTAPVGPHDRPKPKQPSLALEEVERFTMTSRIF